jgi:predicted nucleotidyltransferase
MPFASAHTGLAGGQSPHRGIGEGFGPFPGHAPTRAAPLPRKFQSIAVGDIDLRMATVDNPVLRRFRTALDEVYGERIERVVLFGSRARGDARPDSDYDVAVFLEDFSSFGTGSGHIAEIEIDILDATGAIINAMPFKAGAYEERTGLMRELRREGVDL